MKTELAELREEVSKLAAEVKLLNAKNHPRATLEISPWITLNEAAIVLHFKSARALRTRILKGRFPPDCWQQIPSPSGKRNTYLVNAQRYLKRLN